MRRSMLALLIFPLPGLVPGADGPTDLRPPPSTRADLPVVEEVLLDEIGQQRVIVEELVLAFHGMAEAAGMPPDDPDFRSVRQQAEAVRLLYNGIVARIAFQIVEGHDVRYLQYVQDLEAARAEVETLEAMIPGDNFLGLLEKAAGLVSGLLGTVAETLDAVSARAERVEGRVEAPPEALSLVHRLEMAQSIRDAFAFRTFDAVVRGDPGGFE